MKTKGAATTYQEQVQNALENFTTLIADNTAGAINWDKADFKIVTEKAEFLARLSVKAYK